MAVAGGRGRGRWLAVAGPWPWPVWPATEKSDCVGRWGHFESRQIFLVKGPKV